MSQISHVELHSLLRYVPNVKWGPHGRQPKLLTYEFIGLWKHNLACHKCWEADRELKSDSASSHRNYTLVMIATCSYFSPFLAGLDLRPGPWCLASPLSLFESLWSALMRYMPTAKSAFSHIILLHKSHSIYSWRVVSWVVKHTAVSGWEELRWEEHRPELRVDRAHLYTGASDRHQVADHRPADPHWRRRHSAPGWQLVFPQQVGSCVSFKSSIVSKRHDDKHVSLAKASISFLYCSCKALAFLRHNLTLAVVLTTLYHALNGGSMCRSLQMRRGWCSLCLRSLSSATKMTCRT